MDRWNWDIHWWPMAKGKRKTCWADHKRSCHRARWWEAQLLFLLSFMRNLMEVELGNRLCCGDPHVNSLGFLGKHWTSSNTLILLGYHRGNLSSLTHRIVRTAKQEAAWKRCKDTQLFIPSVIWVLLDSAPSRRGGWKRRPQEKSCLIIVGRGMKVFKIYDPTKGPALSFMLRICRGLPWWCSG